MTTGCGSAPLRPGNNVDDGELTVNYSDGTCQEGICPTPSTTQETIDAPTTVDNEVESIYTTAISPRDADPSSAAALLGINCRGSVLCNAVCKRSMADLKQYIYKLGKTLPSLSTSFDSILTPS